MIYLIITTSITSKSLNNNDNHRQNRYIDCIQHLLKLIENDIDIKPIIVENNGFRDTYLNNLKCDICYTNNNKLDFNHKGVNELLDIKEIINQYNIKDDDFIIKLTGRYKILNLNFINFIKNNIYNYEAFIKFYNVCTLKYELNDCVLGLFCIKCKYIKEFNYGLCPFPEWDFAEYVRKNINQNNIKEIEHLDLECCFADNLRILIV